MPFDTATSNETKRDHIRQLLDLGASVAECARQAGAHYSYAHSVATAYRKEKAEAEGKIVRPKLGTLKPNQRAAQAITVRKLSGEPEPEVAEVRRDAPASRLPVPTVVRAVSRSSD